VVEDDTIHPHYAGGDDRLLEPRSADLWRRLQAMSWLDEVKRQAAPLPELAILDIRMPGPHGHEIAQRLRRLGQTANTPICIMTAFRFDGDERKQINEMASPDLYLAKPLPEPNELRTMLEEIIQKRAAPVRELPPSSPKTDAVRLAGAPEVIAKAAASARPLAFPSTSRSSHPHQRQMEPKRGPGNRRGEKTTRTADQQPEGGEKRQR
jgi:CheY-like chemotaxis protein